MFVSSDGYLHPLLRRSNTFTRRFIPGVILGALAHAWFSARPGRGRGSSTGAAPPAGAAIVPKKKAAAVPAPQEELKMVLLVNQELKMQKGKIAAQCCHAAVGVIGEFSSRRRTWIKQWEMIGQKKIALKVDTTAELEGLAAKAREASLPFYLVADAGHTQVAAGSKTVLAIGPAPERLINELTGSLALL